MTLMICLIHNLTYISVEDILPFSGDKTVGADLARLKYYRNKITHSDDGKLSYTTFLFWRDEISQVYIT